VARSIWPLLGCLAVCGADITVEQQSPPIDLCACWVARQTEQQPQEGLGPCMTCWATTVMADPIGNGICHYDQQRCLEDEACEPVIACVQQCADAACMNGCIAASTTEIGHDLFLDWSRCFCVECSGVCSGTPEPGVCTAAH
jgi:hypothetical protein